MHYPHISRKNHFSRVAEGARFELAAHEVGAGFQDRWFQPLTHPSDTFESVGQSGMEKLARNSKP